MHHPPHPPPPHTHTHTPLTLFFIKCNIPEKLNRVNMVGDHGGPGGEQHGTDLSCRRRIKMINAKFPVHNFQVENDFSKLQQQTI